MEVFDVIKEIAYRCGTCANIAIAQLDSTLKHGISTPAKPDRRMRFLNRLWFHRNSFEMREPPIQCHALLCPEAFHNRKIFPEPCDAAFRCQAVRWIVFGAMAQADPDNEPPV